MSGDPRRLKKNPHEFDLIGKKIPCRRSLTKPGARAMNKRMIKPLILPVLALALAATGCRTTGSTGSTDHFSKADANKDGQLTSDEASDFIVIGVFEALDRNADGKLSLSECAVDGVAVPTKDFQKRDTNKDGVITRQEAIDYGRKHGVVKQEFSKADTNKDGKLSRAEVTAFYGARE